MNDNEIIIHCKEELARIQSERLRLNAAERRARKTLREARARVQGLRPGITVVVDRDGKRYFFAQCHDSFHDWIEAYPIKKDGTPSKAQRTIYGGWKVEA